MSSDRDYCLTLPYLGTVCFRPADGWWLAAAILVPPASGVLVALHRLDVVTAGILSLTVLVTGALTVYHGRRQARLKRHHAAQRAALERMRERRHADAEDDG